MNNRNQQQSIEGGAPPPLAASTPVQNHHHRMGNPGISTSTPFVFNNGSRARSSQNPAPSSSGIKLPDLSLAAYECGRVSALAHTTESSPSWLSYTLKTKLRLVEIPATPRCKRNRSQIVSTETSPELEQKRHKDLAEMGDEADKLIQRAVDATEKRMRKLLEEQLKPVTDLTEIVKKVVETTSTTTGYDSPP
ncbi:unnamed protein product [Orchesella dallaii]|uniref:Uncharacterized protein n=2 Tax=Orchesella dallaii TaxID=48710 RepID=A0ABP1SAE7_9HEXA